MSRMDRRNTMAVGENIRSRRASCIPQFMEETGAIGSRFDRELLSLFVNFGILFVLLGMLYVVLKQYEARLSFAYGGNYPKQD